MSDKTIAAPYAFSSSLVVSATGSLLDGYWTYHYTVVDIPLKCISGVWEKLR